VTTNFLKQLPIEMKLAEYLDLINGQFYMRGFLLKMLPKNTTCVEIGVHQGDFSSQVLRIVRPKEFHLIDPWKYEESEIYKDAWYGGKAKGGQVEMDKRYEAVCTRFKTDIFSRKVKVHRGYSSDFLSKFPDAYFDWVYIDGNHLYEFVKQDLELAFKKTKPGGYITGDDYTRFGWWKGGVKQALDEFIQEKTFQVVKIKFLQFILQKEIA